MSNQLPLGEIVHRIVDFRGRTPAKLGMEWGGGDIRALSANNVRDGWIDFEKECYLGSQDLYDAWMTRGDCNQGDIVFTMEAPMGNVAQIPDDKKYILSQRVVLLSPKNDLVNKSYLYHFMRSTDFRSQCEELATGTTAKGIKQANLALVNIALPPLPEQKKIAEILSGIDRQREVIAKKAANTFHLRTALGGKIFSSLDGERIPLGEICNPKQWQTISTTQLTDSGYPVYGANGMIGYFSEFNHKDPVLAVTCRGATCGNLTLVPGFSYITGNSMCLDDPRSDTSPEYLLHFLSWRGLKDVISGSAQPQITRSPLQAVEVILPSKEKQQKIVSALESVSNTERSLKAALDRIDLLKQAVSSDLLTGRKRVSV